MEGFVRDKNRSNSPYNGRASPQDLQSHQPPSRETQGANAKRMLKQPGNTAMPHSNSGLPSRGFNNAQNMSAALQHPLSRQRSVPGQAQRHDPYDTDVESLDTTVNQSVIHSAELQNNPQLVRQHGHGDQANQDFDEEDISEATDDEVEQGQVTDGRFQSDDENLLEQHGLSDLPASKKAEWLNHYYPGGFPRVEGDSYPDTTDGRLTETDVHQGGYEGGVGQEYDDRMSPPPQRPGPRSQLPHAREVQRPSNNQLSFGHPPARDDKKSGIYQKGAIVRDQQRAITSAAQADVARHTNAAPFSQPPTYSQTHRENAHVFGLRSNAVQGAQIPNSPRAQHVQHQPSGVPRGQAPRHPASAARRHQLVGTVGPSLDQSGGPPIAQQLSGERSSREATVQPPTIDYDKEHLLGMDFKQLKDESFDCNPRTGAPVITDGISQRPLAERLQFVHKNIEPAKQADFFTSLPTQEWEDAGGWFLEQFQSIMQRSRHARQKKRKLAQEFEAEIEQRHNHISKKQKQVEQAMSKMKEQGEGLVPGSRSPAPSSARPRRT